MLLIVYIVVIERTWFTYAKNVKRKDIFPHRIPVESLYVKIVKN
jgi:hypothetical protein